jgi:putative membrane protein
MIAYGVPQRAVLVRRLGPNYRREGVTTEPKQKRRGAETVGEEPDARFSFANERTFLAWNRTALGCIVAGLAVSHVLKPANGSTVGPKVAGVALMFVGGLLSLFSFKNWSASEMALRLRRPLPHSKLPVLISVVTAAVAVTAMVYSLL